MGDFIRGKGSMPHGLKERPSQKSLKKLGRKLAPRPASQTTPKTKKALGSMAKGTSTSTRTEKSAGRTRVRQSMGKMKWTTGTRMSVNPKGLSTSGAPRVKLPGLGVLSIPGGVKNYRDMGGPSLSELLGKKKQRPRLVPPT